MKIYIYNTLTGKKEEFKPIIDGHISMYHCGPTVYSEAHIGNFRTFILNDLLRRTFEYNDYDVNQVMNITDIDDKTIKRSQEEGIKLSELTQRYEKKFFEDLDSLNILKPIKTPRATENISEMISIIEALLEKGVAYAGSDGIYFDIAKSKDYGKLANLDLDKITKERITNDEYDKENARDFALWKFHTEGDGEVSYQASFGAGRPGWHIECSAMCIGELGEQIDVHTGGSDLIFPHHTNEIAQSESFTDKKFANYWVHGGFMTIDGKKMSKSLGNTFTIDNIREKNIDPIAFRYFVLGAHYRTLLNFTWEALEAGETAFSRLKKFIHSQAEDSTETNREKLEDYKTKFNQYINDDLDMPKALALVWDLTKEEQISFSDKKDLILDFDKIFGLKLSEQEEIEIPEEVLKLIKERDEVREEKNWEKSDEIREKIEKLGFEVMDTKDGTKVEKI